jgi:hypothetical protein
MMLEHHVHPPQPKPEIERMQRRSRDYSEQVLQRFHETRKSGTIRTGGGTGFFGEHEGVPFGRKGLHYWDDKALVHQSVQCFDGQEIEIMERLSFSPDRTKLVCSLEVASGGIRCGTKTTFLLPRQRRSRETDGFSNSDRFPALAFFGAPGGTHTSARLLSPNIRNPDHSRITGDSDVAQNSKIGILSGSATILPERLCCINFSEHNL